MLNLLKFKETADYSEFPNLAPESPVSGKVAYDKYIEEVMPFLDNAGSEVLFTGRGGHLLIGPENREWDYVLLVKHKNVENFLAYAKNEEYLKIAGHRTAALEDSRLLPLED